LPFRSASGCTSRSRRSRAARPKVVASWQSLALIPIGTVLVVVVATSVPARLATRIRTSDALRYE
jgi:ABC-type lipoprotein release transport system permease subunit